MTEDNRSIYVAKRNLEELLQSGQERKRLTEQLQIIMSDVLDEIADIIEVGDEIALKGHRLRVADLESNIGSWRTVVLEYSDEYHDYCYVFSSDIRPGASFYLHGDFRAGFTNATREGWLFVANNLPRIIELFGVENEKIVKALREAFSRLRAMAEAE